MLFDQTELEEFISDQPGWTTFVHSMEYPHIHDSEQPFTIAFYKHDVDDAEWDYAIFDEEGRNVTEFWSQDENAHALVQEEIDEYIAANDNDNAEHGILD